jgi:hypothetical protein
LSAFASARRLRSSLMSDWEEARDTYARQSGDAFALRNSLGVSWA